MKVFILAGEVSGDIHAAKLLRALHERVDRLDVFGIGGDMMQAAGMKLAYHIEQMAFLGVGEIIRHLPFIRNVFKQMVRMVKEEKPDVIILVDYPGFNLRFARAVKKLGFPVIYFISPQLWAWGRRRVTNIKAYIDKMLVIFPFEVDFYRKYGITAHYVGHPFADSHFAHVQPKPFASDNLTLGLLPGSRRQELKMLLPRMLQTARELQGKGLIKRALIARVDHIPHQEYERQTAEFDFIDLYEGPIHLFYNQLDAALVSSGTATLETAYFQVPLVIVYHVSWLTWHLAKRLVKLDKIGLANIVAGKKIAPELLQNDFTPDRAASEISRMLDKTNNSQIRQDLAEIRAKLGEPGASQRAADKIIDFLSG